jgi:ribosome-associated toxin RatA of RatAB toxin-antitoxin module
MNVSRSALLPYTADQIYYIVTDIHAYPDFLNWCSAADIVSESDDEVMAKLSIAYGKLNLNFTTRNVMRPSSCVTMSLVEGPFSKLNGQWTIQSLNENACKVSLEMDFKFSNIFTQKLFGRVFQNVIAAQLDAFQKRAESLYT